VKARGSALQAVSLALALCMAIAAAGAPASSAPLRRRYREPAEQGRRSQPQPQPPPQQPSGPPPYEPDLLRLSQIIGSLAYLRNLCGAHDGEVWRAKMAKLLDAEGQSQTVRERLAGAYNEGFRDYELIYRRCTPNARIVISRYLAEGSKLTRKVTSHYGGG